MQISLRSHVLSCLSQSLFSSITDQHPVPIKLSCPEAFAPLSPTAWGSLPPNRNTLFPSSNAGSVPSRYLVQSSLKIILHRIFFISLSLSEMIFICLVPFFPTRMETPRSETCLSCPPLYWPHFDIDKDVAQWWKNDFLFWG